MPGASDVNHCFPLTLDALCTEVAGVAGVLHAYDGALQRVLLSGPTCFSPVVRAAATVASQPYSPTLQHYSILLILTDGVINDMEDIKAAIVAASDKPLSIVIR